MTSDEFIEKWGKENLNLASASSLEALNLSAGTVDFLSIAGLPRGAAPFLSFKTGAARNSIDRLSNIFGLDSSYERYIVIGSDGGGNPIAIDLSNSEEIVLLDHEDEFVMIETMNSSINNLAACVTYFRDFIERINNENGSDSFLNSRFTDEQFDYLKSQIYHIEPSTKYGFWRTELSTLIGNRNT